MLGSDGKLDRAGFAMVATGLKGYLAQEGGAESLDTKRWRSCSSHWPSPKPGHAGFSRATLCLLRITIPQHVTERIMAHSHASLTTPNAPSRPFRRCKHRVPALERH
jgi:hypothetical protein